ncbi:MAG: alpha-amylase [Spirochaetaceae bacterium]|nr:MAG: alpha-amylase [Spirochaetaceae bacterium]
MDSKQAAHLLATLLDTYRGSELSSDREFFMRLAFHFRDIARLSYSLYGGRSHLEEWTRRLVDLLYTQYRARPRRAREVDRVRERNPKWYLSNQLVSTMLYVDRFAGNLAGLRRRIGHFRDLGVNLVHLMPLLDCPAGANDGGYAVRDYRAVDPRIGSMDELVALIEAFHDDGILVQLDLVVNHTSDQHQWAQRAAAGDQRYQDYYYMYEDRSIPDQFEASMPEVFPQSAPGNFTWLPEVERWVMTVFHEYQWDLNYTNPDVFLEMLDVMLYLSNCGADVLRLDAVPYLWKKIGTTGQNLDEAHTILRLFRVCASIVAPAVALMAEAVVQPAEIVRYFGTDDYAGRECEMAYHVSLMVLLWDCIATRSTRLLRRGLESMPEIPRNATWFTYIRCHDDIGLGYADQDIRACGLDPFLHRRFIVDYFTGRYPGSTATGSPFMVNLRTGDARISGSAASLLGLESAIERGDRHGIETAIDCLIMLYAIVCSIGGIPIIYYGDEVGYLNDYSYLDEPDKREDNRWMHRPRIDWNKMARSQDCVTVEGRVFARMKQLIARRKELPEFAADFPAQMMDPANEHVVAYLRYCADYRTLVLANVSDVTQIVSFDVLEESGIDPSAADVLSGRPAQIEGEYVVLRPYAFLWLRHSVFGESAPSQTTQAVTTQTREHTR